MQQAPTPLESEQPKPKGELGYDEADRDRREGRGQWLFSFQKADQGMAEDIRRHFSQLSV